VGIWLKEKLHTPAEKDLVHTVRAKPLKAAMLVIVVVGGYFIALTF